MEARDVLKRPVITEKSSEAMAEDKYTFDVDTRANKTQVKIAVEEIFDVKVDSVNLSLIHISEPTRHSAISRMPSSA